MVLKWCVQDIFEYLSVLANGSGSGSPTATQDAWRAFSNFFSLTNYSVIFVLVTDRTTADSRWSTTIKEGVANIPSSSSSFGLFSLNTLIMNGIGLGGHDIGTLTKVVNGC